MNQAIKRKWVEALLSGNYEQGDGQLGRQGKYCCLGVLVVVAGGESDLRDSYLEPDDCLKFGLTKTEQHELAEVNDSGAPFEMIAGLIHEAL